MKNLVLGVIFSLFITISSIASVSAEMNFPGGKKKKCCNSEKKEKCESSEKKSCCKDESKKDCKKDKKSCEPKTEEKQ